MNLSPSACCLTFSIFFSSAPIITNGPTNVASGTISGVGPSPSSAGNGDIMVQSSGNNNINDVHSAPPSDKSNQVATDASGTGPASSSAVHFSSSDPVLVPSDNSWFPGAAGAIRREVGSQHSLGESNAVNSAKNKLTAASETGASSVQGKIQDKSPGVAKNHGNEIPSPSTPVTHGSPSVSRPSSNYNNRSQQVGSQKGNFLQLDRTIVSSITWCYLFLRTYYLYITLI